VALSIDVTLASGLTAPDSYVRVTSVHVVTKTQASASLLFFASPTSQIAYQTTEQTFIYVLDGPNPIKQAYLHLKTLPEFFDAADC
jgi:hypothetical protein